MTKVQMANDGAEETLGLLLQCQQVRDTLWFDENMYAPFQKYQFDGATETIHEFLQLIEERELHQELGKLCLILPVEWREELGLWEWFGVHIAPMLEGLEQKVDDTAEDVQAAQDEALLIFVQQQKWSVEMDAVLGDLDQYEKKMREFRA